MTDHAPSMAAEGEEDPEVLYALGESLDHPAAGPGELARALDSYLRAGEAGHVAACYRVGKALLEGRGCPRDPAGAIRWLRQAAEA
ncbi:MAG: sel1 repeat family protein, partial [Gammaproteobacteria bacterium]|nr:sel1 repeat family protein [Gammaproteobacteria bacterium]